MDCLGYYRVWCDSITCDFDRIASELLFTTEQGLVAFMENPMQNGLTNATIVSEY